jgi:hypothetical protein
MMNTGSPFNTGTAKDHGRGFFTSGGQNTTSVAALQDYLEKIAASTPSASEYARQIGHNDKRVTLLNRELANVERSDLNTLGLVQDRYTQTAIMMLTAFEPSFWLKIAPVQYVEGGESITWDGIIIKAGLPDETPIHTRSRLVKVEAYAGGTTMTRVSKGLEVSLHVLAKGPHHGMELLNSMASTLTATFESGRALRIVQAILNTMFNQNTQFPQKMPWTHGSLEDTIRSRRIHTWGALKMQNPLPAITDYMTDLLKRQDVNLATGGLALLLHKHTNSVLNLQLIRNNFSKTGVPREGWEENTADGFTVRGISPTLYLVEASTNSTSIVDPFSLSHCLGLMAPIVDTDHQLRSGIYNPALRTRKLFSMKNSCWFPVTIDEARKRSDRWDPVTGDLNSMTNAQNWSHLQPHELLKFSGATFDDIWFCPDTKRPASMLGSAPQFDSAHFLNSVRPLIARWTQADVSKYESAVDGLLNVVGIIEAQPVNNPAGTALITKLATMAVVPMARTMTEPFTPCLAFAGDEFARNVTTGFLSADVTAEMDKAAWDLPPFIGSYAGLSWLVTEKANIANLKARSMIDKIETWLDDFDELAERLSRAFGQSVAMSPAYATGEWASPSQASQLFDYLIPNRSPLWVSVATAPARTEIAALTAARAQLLAAAKKVNTVAAYKDTPAGLSRPNENNYVAGQVLVLSVIKSLDSTGNATEISAIKSAYEGIVTAVPYDVLPPADLAKKIFTTQSTLELATNVLAAIDSARNSTGFQTKFVRSPLWVSPSQISQLDRLTATISDPKNREIPLGSGQLQALQANQADIDASGFAEPLSATPTMANGLSFKRAAHVNQAVMRFGQGGRSTDIDSIRASLGRTRSVADVSSRRVSSAVGASSDALKFMAGLGSSAADTPLSASYTGPTSFSGKDEFKKYFGCADPAIVYGVNSVFIDSFNRLSHHGVSKLQQLMARVMMSMPTNLKAITQMEGAGVPLGDNYVILRALQYMSNVVVLMKPGAETMNLLLDAAGPAVMWGVKNTEYYFVTAAETLAVAVRNPQNICVQADFDPVKYMGGMTEEWRDLDKHTQLPCSRTIGDMICMAIPAGMHCMPSYWTPTGVITAVGQGAIGASPQLEVYMGVESFENIRLGWDKPGHLAPSPPTGKHFGNNIAPSVYSPLYHLDCVQYPKSAEQNIEWKKESRDTVIPRSLYKTNLRDKISGTVAVHNVTKQ